MEELPLVSGFLMVPIEDQRLELSCAVAVTVSAESKIQFQLSFIASTSFSVVETRPIHRIVCSAVWYGRQGEPNVNHKNLGKSASFSDATDLGRPDCSRDTITREETHGSTTEALRVDTMATAAANKCLPCRNFAKIHGWSRLRKTPFSTTTHSRPALISFLCNKLYLSSSCSQYTPSPTSDLAQSLRGTPHFCLPSMLILSGASKKKRREKKREGKKKLCNFAASIHCAIRSIPKKMKEKKLQINSQNQ